MSCNLEHVLYNKRNSTDEEKEQDAYAFAKEERYEEKIEMVVNLLKLNKLSIADIAEASGLPVAEVQAIKDSLQ